jgi:hypothetical protein
LSDKYRFFWFEDRLSGGADCRWVGAFSGNKYFLISWFLYSIISIDKIGVKRE